MIFIISSRWSLAGCQAMVDVQTILKLLFKSRVDVKVLRENGNSLPADEYHVITLKAREKLLNGHCDEIGLSNSQYSCFFGVFTYYLLVAVPIIPKAVYTLNFQNSYPNRFVPISC